MVTRRTFAGVACLAAAMPLTAKSTLVRFGGPTFLKSEDPAELAKEHRRLGYSAAYCPNASIQDAARIKAIEKAFLAESTNDSGACPGQNGGTKSEEQIGGADRSAE